MTVCKVTRTYDEIENFVKKARKLDYMYDDLKDFLDSLRKTEGTDFFCLPNGYEIGKEHQKISDICNAYAKLVKENIEALHVEIKQREEFLRENGCPINGESMTGKDLFNFIVNLKIKKEMKNE